MHFVSDKIIGMKTNLTLEPVILRFLDSNVYVVARVSLSKSFDENMKELLKELLQMSTCFDLLTCPVLSSFK